MSMILKMRNLDLAGGEPAGSSDTSRGSMAVIVAGPGCTGDSKPGDVLGG